MVTLFWRRRDSTTDDLEIWVDALNRRAVHLASDSDPIEVLCRVGEKTVADPRIVDFYLWSAGKEDIGAKAFDRGQPFVVDLGQPIAYSDVVTKKGSLDNVHFDTTGPSAKLIVEPGLLRRGDAIHFRLISDGPPSLSITNPVANLNHASLMESWTGDTPLKRGLKRTGSVFLGIGAVLFLGSIVLGTIFAPVEAGLAAVIVLTPVGFGLTGALLLVRTLKLDRRARKAQDVLRRSIGVRMLDHAYELSLIARRPGGITD